MKPSIRPVLAVTFVLLSLAGCASSGVNTAVSADAGEDWRETYRDLNPYGHWVEDPLYGWVWYPGNSGPNFRPYYAGHWLYTDAGYTWWSPEPWGWATYHYGRWAFVPRYGWVWVPGRVWGPGWVAWRSGGGYVGWAPLTPGRSADERRELSAEAYVFVTERDLGERDISSRALPPARNREVLPRTREIGGVEREKGGKVVNRGPAVDEVERGGAKIGRGKVDDSPGPTARPGGEDEVVKVKVKPSLTAEAARQRTEEWHTRQVRALESRHARELKNPPPGTSAPELSQRHEAERRDLEREYRRRLRGAEE